MDTPDPSQLRISDQDRHQVAEVLREAAGEGRIDLEELDQRLDATYAARTYADLVPITLDLPAAPAAQPAQPPRCWQPVAGGARSVAGAAPRDPRWPRAQGRLDRASGPDGRGVHGRCRPRPAEAQFAAREVTITINAIMGGADIKVNPQTHVIMEGIGILGGYSGPSDDVPAELDANSPLVRIRGFALMGGVSVTRKPAPGDRRGLTRGAD